MPAIDWRDPDGSRKDPPKRKYENLTARSWTVTDEGLDAAIAMRREAAADNAFWNALKADCVRFAKEHQKQAQRMERAVTIWLDHFTKPGRKSVLNMPAEMAEELDAVFRAMNAA
jgi:hypothetical protein